MSLASRRAAPVPCAGGAASVAFLLPASGGGLIFFVLLSDPIVSCVELEIELLLLRFELRLELRAKLVVVAGDDFFIVSWTEWVFRNAAGWTLRRVVRVELVCDVGREGGTDLEARHRGVSRVQDPVQRLEVLPARAIIGRV